MRFFNKIFQRSKSAYVPTEKEMRWNKFIDEVCLRQLNELNDVQKIAVLAFWYDAEMNSGGHSGYFDCYPNVNPHELCEALVAIGASAFADNYQQALLNGEEDDYVQTDRVFGTFEPILTEIIMEFVELHHGEIF